jgi:hypothetical protein
VNLQLDAGNNNEVGDVEAYNEVVSTFAEQLEQGTTAWVDVDGEFKRGKINRVNCEEKEQKGVTYDFQYTEEVTDEGKRVDKTFLLKDLQRIQIKTRQVLVKGDPAGGKTTFAKQLLTWIMRSGERNGRQALRWLVPVMIRTVDLQRTLSNDDRDQRTAEAQAGCTGDDATTDTIAAAPPSTALAGPGSAEPHTDMIARYLAIRYIDRPCRKIGDRSSWIEAVLTIYCAHIHCAHYTLCSLYTVLTIYTVLTMHHSYSPRRAALFAEARRAGRLLLILDGFDEAGGLEGELTAQIQRLLVDEVFLVVTSRDMAGVFILSY